MGLFGKLLPTSPPSRIGVGGAGGGGAGRSSNNQEGGDYWIPSAIEFASHSQDDEEELNQQQQHQDGGGFYDSFLSNSTGSGIVEYSGAAVVPAATSTGGGGGGIGSGRGGSSSGAGSGGFGTMTGQGINSREISPPHPSLMTNTTDAMPTRRAHDMVGTGINSRLSAANATQQQPAQQQYYQQRQYEQQQQQNHYEQQQQYQQQQQYYYQQQQQQQHQQQHAPPTTNPFLVDDDDDDDDCNAAPGLNESMKLMEEKLKSIDNSKFMHFDHNYTTTDDDDDGIDGDGFTSESKSSGGGNDNAKKTKKKSKSGATGLIKMFGKKKEKMRLRRQQQLQEQQQKQSQSRYHRPIVDSDSSSSEENDVNSNSHISGEEDYHTSDKARRSSKTAQNSSYGGGGIGVPNGNGSQLTTAQLEDELYRYKLETLNLTDACRDLLEQLDEVEGRLGTVQAQATFRIHALEAELQDNTLGLKSLVKMTSTEMDGRLEALRAVSKTMSVQAARLKERDGELVLFEQRLRKAQREIRRLKRQNKKVMDEKSYLKTRLDELNQSKYQLEEDMQALVTENEVKAVALSAEEQSKMEDILKELEEKLDQLENVKSKLECKDRELIELLAHVEEKNGEVLKMRQELDTKEQDIDKLEVQLEKVRRDLLDAAAAAITAEEARVEAEDREAIIRSELDNTLRQMEEVTNKVSILERQESELKKQLESAKESEDARANIEEQRALLAEVQNEVEMLREEKEAALSALSDAHATHDGRIAILEAEIDSLNKDVDVHREQMELAQSMLEEKETLAAELRDQLEIAMKEEAMHVEELEEQLASRSRDVNKITIELEERNNYIEILETKLEMARKEFIDYQMEIETRAIAEEGSVAAGDDGTVQSTSTVPHKDRLVKLAEKDTHIDHLEREIRASNLQVEQLGFELDEKDKHADHLSTELERRKAKVEEIEAQLNEKDKTVESLHKQLNNEKEAFNAICEKLTKLQTDLSIAVEATEAAEEAHQQAKNEMQAAEAARQDAVNELEELKSLVEEVNHKSEAAVAEVELLKSEVDKERKSSIQAAATLAATNAARQVEMEMTIEKLEKENDSQRHEIEAIQSELKERAEDANRLAIQLQEAKDDLINHKRDIEAEREKIEAEKEAEVLKRVADRDYFDEDDMLSTNSNAFDEAEGNVRGKGLLGGLFQRSSNDIESDYAVDWKAKAREKDARIAQLEKSLADNSLSLGNLRMELVAVTSKFKEDESQRRLLIQRLENENQAFSQKLEILETEFGGSAAMGMSLTDMTTTTGASQQTERDNMKLKKQKRVYEARIESLQTQLSEIQQIVPELMSKSKLQIQKLENVIEHQRQETKENETKLMQEVAKLREQNAQLQAATRSRLQSSDVGRQHEIEELRLRLEAREATIKKLEALGSSGGSIRKKGGKILRKKKKKSAAANDDGDMSVLSVSTWGTEQQL